MEFEVSIYKHKYKKGEYYLMRLPKRLGDRGEAKGSFILLGGKLKLYTNKEVSNELYTTLLKKLISLLGEVDVPEGLFSEEEIKVMQEAAESG